MAQVLLSHFNGANNATAYTTEDGQSFNFVGTPKIVTTDKKFGSSSLYFDSSNNSYISLPDSSNWNFGSGDFTIDFWVKMIDTDLTYFISYSGGVYSWSTVNGMIFIIYYYNGSLIVSINNNSGGSADFSIPVTLIGAWHHIALVRVGNRFDLYVDGVSLAYLNSSLSFPTLSGGTPGLIIGGAWNTGFGNHFNGYLDEIRIVKGQAWWNTNFSVPTVEYGTPTSYISPKFSSHFNGANNAVSYTTETGQVCTFVGSAKLDTSQKKFGSSALCVDGTSGFITSNSSSDYDFGSGDFTIECWAYLNEPLGNLRALASYGGTEKSYNLVDGSSWQFQICPDSKLTIGLNNNGVGFVLQNTNPINISNGWHHLAAIRNSNILTLYVDGINVGSRDCSSLSIPVVGGTTKKLIIGACYLDGEGYWKGWIDEVRIVKGQAVWTSNFTPPMIEYVGSSVDNHTAWSKASSTLSVGTGLAQVITDSTYVYVISGRNQSDTRTTIQRAFLNNPTVWKDTGAVFPDDGIGSGAIATIGNNAYIYGGFRNQVIYNSIYSASLSDLTVWTKSSKTLPIVCQGSSVYVGKDTAYLFGGLIATSYGTNAIMTASTSDPTTWTVMSGKALAYAVGFSHCFTINGYIYLFGGYDGSSGVLNKIQRASINDPTTWVDTGATLPYAVEGGSILSLGEYLYIVGGYASTNIMRCNISDPLVWQTVSALKPTASDIELGPNAIVIDRKPYIFGYYMYPGNYGTSEIWTIPPFARDISSLDIGTIVNRSGGLVTCNSIVDVSTLKSQVFVVADSNFSSDSKWKRVVVIYKHSSGQKIRIVHKKAGSSWIGKGVFGQNLNAGAWKKYKVIIIDEVGDSLLLKSSDIGNSEDLTIA